jgi:hypothetical protein
MGGRIVLQLSTKLVKHALDAIGAGLLRRRFVDDLQDRGLQSVQAEHDATPLDDLGNKSAT